MRSYKYLIIGGGMTADAAVHGLREMDRAGSIGLISAENDPPYNRPPLTKGLWKGDTMESVWRDAGSQEAELHLGRRATHLDPAMKTVHDDRGQVYHYDKLLLAVGGKPRQLPFPQPIIYFRTLADYRQLRALTDQGRRFAVLGGGFIGSELAAALKMNGKEVVLIFPDPGIGHRMFPRDLSDFVTDYYRQKGVEVWPNQVVASIEPHGHQFLLKSRDEQTTVVDGIVAGLGIELNLDLAKMANLQIDNGIAVNEYLQASQTDIYAAGDVASFFNPALEKRLRVEHEDNANTMGRIAGINMAGRAEPYHHLPFFYSDLFDLGYEAVGELDPRLETVAAWQEPFREGVVYYQKDGRVRGVLLWNVWEQVEAARELIAQNRPYRAAELKEKLPIAA